MKFFSDYFNVIAWIVIITTFYLFFNVSPIYSGIFFISCIGVYYYLAAKVHINSKNKIKDFENKTGENVNGVFTVIKTTITKFKK